MATVKMAKGNRYADIFDSPETIEQAKKDGWELVPSSSKKVEPVKEVEELEEETSEEKPNRVKR